MITYKILLDDQIHVGVLAFVRAHLQDAKDNDLEIYWTTVVVNAVKPDRVEVTPLGSSGAVCGLAESLILRRNEDGYIPIYKLTTS
jgi:hypothetical protein